MGSGPFGTIFQPNHRAPPKCPTTTRVRAYSQADERGTSPFPRLVSHTNPAHKAHGADERGTLWREAPIRHKGKPINHIYNKYIGKYHP